MRRNWVRFALGAGLLAVGCAQIAAPALEPDLAHAFLHAISTFPTTPTGQAKALEILGITEGELTAMRKLSVVTSTAQASYYEQIRGVTLEFRLQNIQNGKVEGWVTEKLDRLQKEKDAVAVAEVSGLREILGEERFEKLGQYIQGEARNNFRDLDDRPRAPTPEPDPAQRKK